MIKGVVILEYSIEEFIGRLNAYVPENLGYWKYDRDTNMIVFIGQDLETKEQGEKIQ